MPLNPLSDAGLQRGMTAQMALRERLLREGARHFGWKAGFGAPAALQKFGLSAPLSGFMMVSNVVESGGVAPLAGWAKPIAEPEIAIRIGADVTPGGDRAAAAAAIAALAPAIELVDMSPPPETAEGILAGNIYHRHVIVGAFDASRAGGRLDGLSGIVLRGGAEVARTAELEAMTGRLPDVVRHIADALGQFGQGLKAGDVLIAGSVVPAFALDVASEESFAFTLDPIGTASVRFK